MHWEDQATNESRIYEGLGGGRIDDMGGGGCLARGDVVGGGRGAGHRVDAGEMCSWQREGAMRSDGSDGGELDNGGGDLRGEHGVEVKTKLDRGGLHTYPDQRFRNAAATTTSSIHGNTVMTAPVYLLDSTTKGYSICYYGLIIIMIYLLFVFCNLYYNIS